MRFIDHLKKNTFDICLLITATKVTQIACMYYGMEGKGSSPFLFESNELIWCFLGVCLASLIGYTYNRFFNSEERNEHE